MIDPAIKLKPAKLHDMVFPFPQYANTECFGTANGPMIVCIASEKNDKKM